MLRRVGRWRVAGALSVAGVVQVKERRGHPKNWSVLVLYNVMTQRIMNCLEHELNGTLLSALSSTYLCPESPQVSVIVIKCGGKVQ